MQRSVRIAIALVLFVATCVGVSLILTQSAEAHGTCANHQYRTYDGTHDGDGDGVGCESKPAPPGRSNTGSSTTGSTSTGSHPAAHRTCAGHQYRTYDGTHDGTATASAANPSLNRPPAQAPPPSRWATTATTGASAQAARAPAWAVAPANTLTTSSRSKRHTIPALPHGRARAKPSSPTTPPICGASQPASISANPTATSRNGPAARAHSASASRPSRSRSSAPTDCRPMARNSARSPPRWPLSAPR